MPQKISRLRVLFGHCRKQVGLVVFGVVSVIGVVLVVGVQPAQAATNNTLNFQARLQSSAGAIAPDGYYNIEFKIYNASTSSGSSQGSCTGDATCLWTETWYDSNGVTAGNDNRVRVKNGYLSVNLGSLNAFPAGINWDQNLWITMNVGGTVQTATPTYDGEMNPRLKLTGLPYAFRAGELAKYNSVTGYTGVLQFQNTTGGNQTFVIPDQGAAGTYTLLTTAVAAGSYIQNTTSPQTANFNITGNGTIGADLALSGSFSQTGSGTFATGTGAISLNGDTTVAAGKNLNVSNGVLSLSGAVGSVRFNAQDNSGNYATIYSAGGELTLYSGYQIRATLTGSGNFGVGLNYSPSYKLDIDGDINTTANLRTGSTVRLDNGGALSNITGYTQTSGNVAFQKGTDFSATGTTNDANLGNGLYIRLTGASAQTITGITGGTNGRVLTVSNAGAATATISNNGAGSAAANRITSGTGSDISLPVGGSISFIYDPTASLWRAIGSVGVSGGGSGVTTVGSFSGSSQTNGASIAGTTITFGPADASNPGMVSTGTQTFAGTKTFNGQVIGGAGLNVSGGAISLTGNAASSLTTSSGALTLTSATAATWSTVAGDLTLQAGSGTVSLGASTALVASGALGIASGAGSALTLDSGTTGAINIGTTSFNKTITIGNTTSATSVAVLRGTSAVFSIGTAGNTDLSIDSAGRLTYRPSAASAAFFQIQNASGNPVIRIDDTPNAVTTINGPVCFRGAGTCTLGTNALQTIDGAVFFTNGGNDTVFTTPLGANLNARLVLQSRNYAAQTFGIALGMGSSSDATARGIIIGDARAGTDNNPVIGIYSPNENTSAGLGWDGSNTTFKLKTQSTTNSNSAGIAVVSGNTNNGNSGNVLVDAGALSGTGTAGAVNLGTTNASAVNIGRSGVTTTSNGALTVNQAFTAVSTAVFQDNVNSATAFQVQNAAGQSLLTVNTLVPGVSIGQGNVTINALPAPTTRTISLVTSGGSLPNATTYGYGIAAYNAAGRSVAMMTAPLSVTTSNGVSRVTVSWSAVAGATGYYVYRTTGSGTYYRNDVGNVTSISDNGSTYTWSGLDYSSDALSATSGNLNFTVGSGIQFGGNANIFQDPISSDLVIANNGGAAVVVQGQAGQTANFLTVQDNFGAQMFTIDQYGDAGFGGNLYTSGNTGIQAGYGAFGNNYSSIIGNNALAAQSNAAGTTVFLAQGSAVQTAPIIDAQNSAGATMFSIGATGNALFKATGTSATAFQVQNSSGSALLTADAQNSRVYIGSVTAGSAATALILSNKNTSGDPTGVAGAMYYNSATGAFRCYEVDYWRDCLQNSRSSYRYDQEFMGISNGGGFFDGTMITATAGAGTTVGQSTTSVASHPGIGYLDTGTTSSGFSAFWGEDTNNSNVNFGSGDSWRYESVLRIPTLSTGTQQFTVRSGFSDGGGTTDGTDSCLFKYNEAVNGGRWQGLCNNNSTPTVCDTTITVAANTWYRLTVVVNAAGTSVDFRINGTSRCTINTGIPTGTARATSIQMTINKSVGTTVRSVDVDYVGFETQFGTSR